MPRVDPITGVAVATRDDLILREAENRGVDPAEVADEWAEQEQAMLQEDTDQFERERDKYLLDSLRQWNAWMADERKGFLDRGDDEAAKEYEPLPEPVEIIEYRDWNYNPWSGSYRLEAKCERPDGTGGILIASYTHWPGNRLEPPEDDLEVWWDDG